MGFQEECGECNGSGLCPACNGEGFLLKNLTPEAAAKARSRAVDAATRYTAGYNNPPLISSFLFWDPDV